MEIRAFEFSRDLVEDLVLLVTEEDLQDYAWPSQEVKTLLLAQGFSGKPERRRPVCMCRPDGNPVKAVAEVGQRGRAHLEKVRRAGSVLKQVEKLHQAPTVLPWK